MVGHIEGRDAVFEHFEAVLAALPTSTSTSTGSSAKATLSSSPGT
jgi:hypothetical protein